MEKEHVTLIVSDVYGTFTSFQNEEDRRVLLEEFYENLMKIGEYNKSNKIFFSLISTETKEYVDSLNDFNSENIINDKNFCEENAVRAKVISDYVNELKKQYEVDEVWYFDDGSMNVRLYNVLFPKLQSEMKTTVIKPENGLASVNEGILEELKKRGLSR